MPRFEVRVPPGEKLEESEDRFATKSGGLIDRIKQIRRPQVEVEFDFVVGDKSIGEETGDHYEREILSDKTVFTYHYPEQFLGWNDIVKEYANVTDNFEFLREVMDEEDDYVPVEDMEIDQSSISDMVNKNLVRSYEVPLVEGDEQEQVLSITARGEQIISGFEEMPDRVEHYTAERVLDDIQRNYGEVLPQWDGSDSGENYLEEMRRILKPVEYTTVK